MRIAYADPPYVTLRRGLAGAKPEAVRHWTFDVLGAGRDQFVLPGDEYPAAPRKENRRG